MNVPSPIGGTVNRDPYKLKPSRERFEHLMASGMSQTQVASLLGVAQSTVSRWRRKGIPIMKTFQRLSKVEIESLLINGLTAPQIGLQLGVSDTTINNWRRRFGMPIVPSGRPQNPYFEPTEQECQLLFGSLLGDGNLTGREKTRKNPMFRESKKIGHRSYLEWKAEQLHRFKPRLRDRPNGPSRWASHLATSRWPNLLPLRRAFYPNGRKVIPRDLIWRLNSLGLAVWYMDDGTYSKYQTSLYLATDSFSKEENQWLAEEYFPKSWGLHPKLVRRASQTEGREYNWDLRFLASDTEMFVRIVRPHVVSVMKYKLGQNSHD